ncbi:hypothetical protein HDA31_000518 [Micromonospora carbonacea subsp. aurantiaca]|uniref:Uncharacterized protein n=1 Tax=Micromonospora carbonacea TaxID=47853 RepID=A0A1C4UIF7_9ACTN|nr:hypothetical protein [Micromonospora carbonacea]SCE71450.1 hypothetical protein GA0070563_101532 [Micromonospora carbonacea]
MILDGPGRPRQAGRDGVGAPGADAGRGAAA